MLAAFSDCPLKAYREYCLGLSSKTPSIHLHAGGAFAAGLEEIRRTYYEKDKPAEKSDEYAKEKGFEAFIKYWESTDVEVPSHGTGSNKTFNRTWGAVEYYLEQFPLETDPIRPYILNDGRSGIEFTVSVPLDIQHPDTGDPIIYGGRFDLLGHYSNLIAIIDEKTTTQLGDSWVKQWDLRGQFIGYVWAARQMGIPVTAAIIRGIAILKTKYNHLEVVKTNFPDHVIDRWLVNMHNKVRLFVEYYRCGKAHPEAPPEMFIPMSFSSACSNYGGCVFKDLCLSKEPAKWYSDFAVRRWNPLEKDPTSEKEREHI